jgi:hypothetical protein
LKKDSKKFTEVFKLQGDDSKPEPCYTLLAEQAEEPMSADKGDAWL